MSRNICLKQNKYGPFNTFPTTFAGDNQSTTFSENLLVINVHKDIFINIKCLQK